MEAINEVMIWNLYHATTDMNNEGHLLDCGKKNEGNQFSVSNLVTNVLNLECKHPHCQEDVAKILSYITGEQFQHMPKTNSLEN